jgi:hypothetical protein
VSTQVSAVTSNGLSSPSNIVTSFLRSLKTYVHTRVMPCWVKISAQTCPPAVKRRSASKTHV